MKFEVISPSTTDELMKSISDNIGHNFHFCAGGTDLLMTLKHERTDSLKVINLAMLQDDAFRSITETESEITIGALATADEILNNDLIKNNFPILAEAANSLASRQIRNVATIGGNVCTASPSGDMTCALVALEANCEILNTDNELRIMPISDYLIDVRKTSLQKNEMLRRIVIPLNKSEKILSHFIKIGTRRSMECSVISLAFHILTDKENMIKKSGIAIGSVAPTIKFVTLACNFLTGRNIMKLSEKDIKQFASLVVEYASPISDIRASAWYRKKVLYNISKGVLENYGNIL